MLVAARASSMSLPMPGNDGTTYLSTGSSLTSFRVGVHAGLTTTTPATRSRWSAATRRASAPPIDSPPTTTASLRGQERVEARGELAVPVLPAGACSAPARWCRARAAAAPRRRTRARRGTPPRPDRDGRAGEAVAQEHADRRPPVSSGRAGRQRGGVGVDRHAAHSAPRALWRDRRSGDQVLRQLGGPPRRVGTRGGGNGVLLVPEVDRPRSGPAARLPAARRGRRERPRRGAGDPGQQPPLLRRLAVHAAHASAPGDLRGEGRVLHHPGHQGLVPEEVLLRGRPGPDRPVGRGRRRGRALVGEADPRAAASSSGSTPRAPAPTTAGSTAARPASRGSRSRPGCR